MENYFDAVLIRNGRVVETRKVWRGSKRISREESLGHGRTGLIFYDREANSERFVYSGELNVEGTNAEIQRKRLASTVS